LVLVTTLAVGLLVGWGGTERASAAQPMPLAKLVNLDQIPVGVGDGPAMWTHVLYIKRIDGERLTLALNELNATMAERGWLFMQLMPHLEDADLKGVWVVYRATGWGPKPEHASSP
jgi:hypothetical protein